MLDALQKRLEQVIRYFRGSAQEDTDRQKDDAAERIRQEANEIMMYRRASTGNSKDYSEWIEHALLRREMGKRVLRLKY